MNGAITLRLALPRDAHAIAALAREHIEAGLPPKYDAARILRAMRRRDTVVLVAAEGSAVRGFAVMEFGEERAHLVLLAVSPGHRRRGIGRRLIEWLLESARTAGIASVHLELRAGNAAARRFYRAMGFSETLLVPGYYGGREAALRMIRVLRAPGMALPAWQPPWLAQK
ncbi:MAG: GNAT family N-acetyltransferase [Burkholderiales bacterium]|nr:GNAT family N-acetyltransferase [Burkholderiales bacterium]